ncbi:MAG: protein kinase [Anaerolineales bacterium]|nr:protein kinase [Anaerolineales bacterium]
MSVPFGPYQLTAKLGTGDMGTVYKATDTRTGNEVALKVLDKLSRLSSSLERDAAVELIEFAATIQHEGLHRIQEVVEIEDETGGKLGIAMPLASAQSLYDHLSTGKRLAQRHAYMVIEKIAEALIFLHNQEVAHGSIKPTNVLLEQNAKFTITDLPMAHLRELGFVPNAPSQLQQYYLLSESTYLSPPSIASDIFALGVLTYHVLTGRLPFDDPEPEARNIPNGEGLMPLVHSVLLRAMTSRPILAYPSVVEFIGDLQLARDGQQIASETAQWFTVKPKDPPPDES